MLSLNIFTHRHILSFPSSLIIQQELCLLSGQILFIADNPPLKEYLIREINSPVAPLAVSVLLSLSIEGT